MLEQVLERLMRLVVRWVLHGQLWMGGNRLGEFQSPQKMTNHMF